MSIRISQLVHGLGVKTESDHFSMYQLLGRYLTTANGTLARSRGAADMGSAVELILGPTARAVEMRANSDLDMRACFRLIRFLPSNRFEVIHNNAMTYFCHIALILGARETPRLY